MTWVEVSPATTWALVTTNPRCCDEARAALDEVARPSDDFHGGRLRGLDGGLDGGVVGWLGGRYQPRGEVGEHDGEALFGEE